MVKDINPNLSAKPDVIAANPTAEGPNFSPGTNVFASPGGVPYGVDVNGVLNGNDVLVVTQSGDIQLHWRRVHGPCLEWREWHRLLL